MHVGVLTPVSRPATPRRQSMQLIVQSTLVPPATPEGTSPVKIQPTELLPCICAADVWGPTSRGVRVSVDLSALSRVHLAFCIRVLKEMILENIFQKKDKCLKIHISFYRAPNLMKQILLGFL
jgi:hypothetical protein